MRPPRAISYPRIVAGIAYGFLSAGGVLAQDAAPAAQDVAPATQDVAVRPAFEIGAAFGAPEYTFGDIADIAVSGRAEIFVLDRMAKQVRRYDADGRHLGSFGREGSGPGEFVRPLSLALHGDTVRVNDPGLARVSVFTVDGEHIETRALGGPSDVPVSRVAPMRGGLLVGSTIARFSRGGPPDRHRPDIVVFATNGDGTEIDTLLVRRSGGAIWYVPGEPVPWGPADSDVAFGAGARWAVSGDSLLAVVDGYDSTVTWYRVGPDGLTTIRSDSVGVDSRPVTEADLARLERVMRADRKADGRSLPRDIAIDAPPVWSAVLDALFATDGSLWVDVRDDEADANIWHAYPPDPVQSRAPGSGGAAGGATRPLRVRLPEDFELEAVHDGRLYGVARTELDVHIVRVYTLDIE